MKIRRSGDIVKITSSQVTSTITASGSGQYWFETDTYFLKFMTPQGSKKI